MFSCTDRFEIDFAELAKLVDQLLNQLFRRRGAGGDSHRGHTVEPARIEGIGVVDQIARDPRFGTDLTQAVRVRAVLRTHHQQDIDALDELANRLLPVLGGVADVAYVRTHDLREPRLERLDDAAGVVHTEGRLGYVGDIFMIVDFKPLDVLLRCHEMHATRNAPPSALDLGMAGVPDQHHLAAFGGMALALLVDLGNQRTSRIDDRQSSLARFVLHCGRGAVGAEDGHRPVRHVGHFLDEHGALGAQALDHSFIVDDLVAHVDRRAVAFEGAFHDLDGALDAGAKSPRLSQQYLQG